MSKKRQLTKEEKAAAKLGIRRLEKDAKYAAADLAVWKAKLSNWDVIRQRYIQQLEDQKVNMERSIEEAEKAIEETPELIKQIEEQIKHGVEIKKEKDGEEPEAAGAEV